MSRPGFLAAALAKLRHAWRFAFGALLFTLCMRLPFAWWGGPAGWLWWALPFIGFYAYSPRPLQWPGRPVSHLARLASRADWRQRCELAEASLLRLAHGNRRLHSELQAERDDRLKLQGALRFWLPQVPLQACEMADRAAADAWLLSGHEALPREATAEARGWIVAMGSRPAHEVGRNCRRPFPWRPLQ